MSQGLANDLPDKFGSSDEEDDEEVVAWMGENGEFEAHSGEIEEADDDEEEMRKFGGSDLFHEGWEGDFHDDDDEFGFRGLRERASNECDSDVNLCYD